MPGHCICLGLWRFCSTCRKQGHMCAGDLPERQAFCGGGPESARAVPGILEAWIADLQAFQILQAMHAELQAALQQRVSTVPTDIAVGLWRPPCRKLSIVAWESNRAESVSPPVSPADLSRNVDPQICGCGRSLLSWQQHHGHDPLSAVGGASCTPLCNKSERQRRVEVLGRAQTACWLP